MSLLAKLRCWYVLVRLKVDAHGVFHVKGARVELMLVVTSGFGLLQVLSYSLYVVLAQNGFRYIRSHRIGHKLRHWLIRLFKHWIYFARYPFLPGPSFQLILSNTYLIPSISYWTFFLISLLLAPTFLSNGTAFRDRPYVLW